MATLQDGFRQGRFTIPSIAEECLRRIRSQTQPVFIYQRPDSEVLEEARRQQDLLLNHPGALERWPLLGIPYGVKDNIDVEAMPTSAACPAFSHPAKSSAPAVAALAEAGALCLGKTNMDQFATGLVGVRSPFGVCRNPFHADYIAGGSSSGSGLAVSMGLCCFSLGTDTAGSGRVPAALGNIIGLKPSRGYVSTRGVVPACPSLDCVSVFSLFAPDAERVLALIGKFDALDPWSRKPPGTVNGAAQPNSMHATSWPSLRVAIPHPGQLDFSGNAEFAALYQQALEHAQALGARCLGHDIGPLLEAAQLLYQGPWIAERYAAISESIDPESDLVLPLLKEVIRSGKNLAATEVFKGQRRLQSLRRSSETLFENCDVLLLPTIPTTFTIADVQANPIQLNSILGRFTNFVNLLDLSAIAIPFGFCANGLPFGITLIAPAFHDVRLLHLAQAWQAKLPVGAGVGLWPHPALPEPMKASVTDVSERLSLMVFGLHLKGQSLAKDLEQLDARFEESTRTAPGYAMFDLRVGAKRLPGVIRKEGAAGRLKGDIWSLPRTALGHFMATLAAPLSLGFIETDSGRRVVGFLAEVQATETAADVTSYGGWLDFLNAEKGVMASKG